MSYFIYVYIIAFIFFRFFFFFNDTATTEIYTLSLHDALPISPFRRVRCGWWRRTDGTERSEEHTSELQSRRELVCRLLLEKKKETETVLEAVMAEDLARLSHTG